MQQKFAKITVFALVALLSFSCKKEDASSNQEPMLRIRIVVDSAQERLGNTGQTAVMPAGHAGQNPRFNKISAHYLELAPTAYTQIGKGTIVYHAAETTTGGDTAIDFSKSRIVRPGDEFLSIPISQLRTGTYQWVRLSLSYQNYTVDYYLNNQLSNGTIASFVGYNQYLGVYPVNTLYDTVNANRLQGYWAFETLGRLASGQSPAGATTVPNPLAATSPIPPGSCVVTGAFASPLVITGNETSDITMTLSLSTNHSFEWEDTNANGKWDIVVVGQTSIVESVVDMGLRGLIPSHD